MRLLIVNALYPPHRIGGAETSVALLAEALARDGVEVHVATLDAGSAEQVVVERGVIVHRLPIDQYYWPWGGSRPGSGRRALWHWRDRWNREAAARFGRLLDTVRPDLVHSHVLTGFGASIWPEVKRRGLSLAHSLRDYALICPRSALFRNGQPCVSRCVDCQLVTRPTRAASALVDAVAGNSDFILAAHRDAGRFKAVGGRSLFNVVPRPKRVSARPTEGPLTFGFMGRIEAEKGIETLLDALPHIGRDAWRLRIAGVGRDAYAERLRRQSDDPRIDWLGWADAGDFVRSIDVLMIPSLWPEPLPRTLVEGVAHGRSIIAAASGGIPEVATIGRCIALFRPGDARALAGVMRGAIDHSAPWRTGGAASAEALDPFSERAVVAAHHEFYDAARRATTGP